MVEISKDDLLTHSILNYLRATFVGQLVFHKALKELKSTLIDDSYVESAHRALDKIDPWLKDLFTGVPIFSTSWTAPETFEAIRAFGYLKDIKKDLIWLATQLDAALNLPNLVGEKEGIRLLVGGLVRTAHTRAEYLNGVGAFFTQHKDEERVNLIRPQFGDARAYVSVTDVIFDTFRSNEDPDADLVERLRREALLTPCDFRAQMHDATLLLNSYNKNLDYADTDFAGEAADEWKAAGTAPAVAGYWWAYNFKPEEATAWSTSGLGNASLAANWKRSGFNSNDSVAWYKAGFAPAIARVWKEADFDPERAASMVQRGMMTPDSSKETTAEDAA